MGVLQQIKLIADFEGVTITALEGMIGASRGVLSRAFRNDTDISSNWIIKIVENYPHYNCRWILTGDGNMLNDGQPVIVAEEPNHQYKKQSHCYICDAKERVIENQAERIQELKETIFILKGK